MGKSAKEVLAELQSNMPKLAQALPDVTGDFMKKLMPDALRDGAISKKVKELIALGISVCLRCDYCIAMHVKNCFEAGATKEEITEVLGVAILMGGGPAMAYSTFVMQAIEELAPKS